MSWECKEHNQDEYTCIKDGEYEYHIKKFDALNDLKKDKLFTRKRCLGCICENKNNLTDDIDNCPIYPNNDFNY